jgi:hypothetical protein
VLRIALASCLVAAACAPAHASPAPFAYLGQIDLPPGLTFDGTTVGGLSGISYDPRRQLYYVISDDRSAKNPARFYTVRISLADNRLGDVQFVSTTPFLDPAGVPFPPLSADTDPPVIPPDPEGIAFDERRQQLYWSSEGERNTDDPANPLLLNPWVRVAGIDGDYRGEFTIPGALNMSTGEMGARQNHALEGLTLPPGGDALWAAMEAPGYNDGDPPTNEHGALTRVTRFDVDTGTPTAQFAYPLDSVSAGPDGDNGLTDLVALDDENFLVLERGYGTHVVVRVYRATVAGADNVLGWPSLAVASPKTMTKSLVADLSTLADIRHLDNVEGITLGPKLSDGRQSVVLVADDNFNDQQITQFYAFAM